MKGLYKVFYSGPGDWCFPNSEKQIEEAKEGGVSNSLDWTIKEHKPDSVPKIGQWIAPLPPAYEKKFAMVAGVFNLQPINYLEIKYKNESKVQCLLPCYDHEDGLFLDGYTQKDSISFRIKSNRGYEKFTMKDVLSEETEKKTDNELGKIAERTLLNIIGTLLEFIKGDIEGIKPHPEFSSEADLIEIIASEYNKRSKTPSVGLSQRNLEKKFKKAKESLSDCVNPPKPKPESKRVN